MVIGVDKGQKAGKHVLKHNMLIDRGNELRYVPLPYGDYIQITPEIATLVEGKMEKKGKTEKKDLHGIIPVSVDTKRNIEELYGNLVGGKNKSKNGNEHERFRNECILAKENGCQLYILVENTDGVTSLDDFNKWKNEQGYKRYANMRHRAFKNGWTSPKPPVPNASLVKMMKTMTERYGVEFLFCKPEEAAEMVEKLLTGGSGDGEKANVQQ